MLEEFKNCVPESVEVHDQKVTSLIDAAVLADEFALTHRNVFTTARRNVLPLPDESRVFSHAKTDNLIAS